MRLFRLDAERKCGGCNWPTTYVYVLANTREEAEELYRKEEAGLCGDCIGDLLSDYPYEITSPNPAKA